VFQKLSTVTIIKVEVKMGAAGSFESLLSIHDTKYCYPKDSNMISSERCTFVVIYIF